MRAKLQQLDRMAREGRLRHLPILASSLLAALTYVTLGGYYAPDTTAFLAQGFVLGGLDSHSAPPLYPSLLELLVLVIGRPEWRFPALVLLQLAAHVASVGLASAVVARLGGPRLGLIAGMLLALSPQFYLIAHRSQTEGIFLLLALGTVYAWVRALGAAIPPRRALLWAAATGLLAGLALCQRTVGFALPACLAIASLLCIRREALTRSALRKSLLLTAALGVAFTLPLGLAKLRNHLAHDRSNLVDGRGIHLMSRISSVADSLPDTEACRRLEEIASAAGVLDLPRRECGWEVETALMKSGFSREEADELMVEAAKETIRANPLAFLSTTLSTMGESAIYDPPDHGLLWVGVFPDARPATMIQADLSWGGWLVGDMLEEFPPHPARGWLGDWSFWAIHLWSQFGILWTGPPLVLLTFVIAALALWQRDPLPLWSAGLALALLLIPALTEVSQPRFWMTSIPFLVISGLLVFARLPRRGASLAMGVICLAALLAFARWIWTNPPTVTRERAAVENRLRPIGLALQRYSKANDGEFPMNLPGGPDWLEQIRPFLPDYQGIDPFKASSWEYHRDLAAGRSTADGKKVPIRRSDLVHPFDLVVLRAVDPGMRKLWGEDMEGVLLSVGYPTKLDVPIPPRMLEARLRELD